MTVAELNALDREAFVNAIGWVFEKSPWVAERTWASRPFTDAVALHSAMVAQVESAAADEQLQLLCAHPDLGTRARMMAAASAAEQSGAGLDCLAPDEFDHLRRLNSRYREKFGFPFLYAVKGSSKHDILRALERRVSASAPDEYREALRQVYRIAEFRLHDAMSKGEARTE